MINHSKRKSRLPKVLRTGAIAAAMAMALAVTAGAVNLATGGVFFQTLRQVWTDGYVTQYECLDSDGNPVELSVTQGSTVHETEDGRLLLRAAGEEVDITEDLRDRGEARFEKALDQRTVQVTVTGTTEDWTLVETVTEANGDIYRSRFTSDEMPGDMTVSVSGVTVEQEEPAEDGAVRSSTVTVTENGDGSMTLTDGEDRSFQVSGAALPTSETD